MTLREIGQGKLLPKFQHNRSRENVQNVFYFEISLLKTRRCVQAQIQVFKHALKEIFFAHRGTEKSYLAL